MTVMACFGARKGACDFDFLNGVWNVRHRRLSMRLANDSNWVEFGGTTLVRPILGGLGNFDKNVIELPSGTYEACTLRLFNPKNGLWSTHWIDGRDPKLDPPMIGSFKGGTGIFLGDDELEGRKVRVRFLWTGTTTDTPRWEQAFSVQDGGWETNWIMDFNRA